MRIVLTFLKSVDYDQEDPSLNEMRCFCRQKSPIEETGRQKVAAIQSLASILGHCEIERGHFKGHRALHVLPF